ncbi:hypothetical protein Tel_12280 [Candidatus Tenderia electrophaga]|jgi:hypothetical protein|uniref:Uncharacterized protein n=1 Tax=Candidatus Tenderia electrophaga TaxID=1748243 RepID=A0A0S2TFD3_9GAMM|nr:hypothetical protein Tel_12280 [Candidatus Tenderia electrophaga]
MSEAPFIKRRARRQLESGFDSLRREGIALAQQLSGKQWTDYNLHDPGVTILEQLCFAITDLIYRAGFPVEDYLAGAGGEIDFERQSLHRPERIFPCRPTTVLDYRKALLNAVSELDNVWLVALSGRQRRDGVCRGLYRIALKLEQGVEETERGAVVEKVRRFYETTRNLCEDVADVSIVPGQDYHLRAEVEVGSARRPVDIMAEIYFHCARRIAGGVTLFGYEQAVREGDGLDEVFCGPFTDHGLLKDAELDGDRAEFPVATLYAVINSIEGVDHVREVYLERDGERYYDVIESAGQESACNLFIPQRDEQVQIVLTTNGRVLPVSMADVRAKFDELTFRYRSTRASVQPLSQLYQLPRGKARFLSSYASIQEQFPASYGIGFYGLPESAAAPLKARAKQLKAYLLLFEQFMANYLANLDNIGRLFSIDDAHQASYQIQPLTPEQVAGLEELYPLRAAEALKRIMAKFDDHPERKSRLLDYLLALYGESFSQHSLRHFNYYYGHDELEQLVVENKIELLCAVVELGRDRAGGSDYRAESWTQRGRSGLQHRVSILLNFRNHAPRALSMAILKQGLKLTQHHVYEQLKTGSAELEFIDTTKLADAGFERVRAPASFTSDDIDVIRSRIEDAIPLKNNLLSDVLLHGGIDLDRYRLGSLTSGQDYQLTFLSDDERHWYLGTFSEREEGAQAARALRDFLLHLNAESEGLHILEHLLLRPVGAERHVGMSLAEGEDFYSFRISVIFPAYTARCANKHFRMLAEETVRINTPPHIYPEFYWLEFHKLYEFEILYEKWQSLKSAATPDSKAINQASSELIRFLLENRAPKEGGIRPPS